MYATGDQFASMMDALVPMRKSKGLSISAANAVDCYSLDVEEFEYDWSDPSLRFVEKYASAVGAAVHVSVVDAEQDPIWRCDLTVQFPLGMTQEEALGKMIDGYHFGKNC